MHIIICLFKQKILYKIGTGCFKTMYKLKMKVKNIDIHIEDLDRKQNAQEIQIIQSHVINEKQKAALNALIGKCRSTKTDERRVWLQKKRYFNFRSFVVHTPTPTPCNMDYVTFSMIPGILGVLETAMTIFATTSIVFLFNIQLICKHVS